MISRHCPLCGDARMFERPPCPDGHGADCPELVCVDCGTALLAGLVHQPVGAITGAASRVRAVAAPPTRADGSWAPHAADRVA